MVTGLNDMTKCGIDLMSNCGLKCSKGAEFCDSAPLQHGLLYVRERNRRLCPFAAPPTTIRRHFKFHRLSRCRHPASPSEERRNNSNEINASQMPAHHTSRLCLSICTLIIDLQSASTHFWYVCNASTTY